MEPSLQISTNLRSARLGEESGDLRCSSSSGRLCQFGTDLIDRFQHLWIHPHGVRPVPAEKYIVRTSSSWDVVEISQRMLSFDESGLWTRQSALRGKLFTLWFCKSSSQDLISIMDKYVPVSMEKDVVDGIWSPSPWVQLESWGRVGRFSRSAKVQKLTASSRWLPAESLRTGGVVTHSNGELAVLPLGMAILNLVDHLGRLLCFSFPLGFPLPSYASIFGLALCYVYVWLLWYAVWTLRLFLRILGIALFSYLCRIFITTALLWWYAVIPGYGVCCGVCSYIWVFPTAFV